MVLLDISDLSSSEIIQILGFSLFHAGFIQGFSVPKSEAPDPGTLRRCSKGKSISGGCNPKEYPKNFPKGQSSHDPNLLPAILLSMRAKLPKILALDHHTWAWMLLFQLLWDVKREDSDSWCHREFWSLG